MLRKNYLNNVHIAGATMRAGSKARGDELRGALIDAAEKRLAEAGLAALTVRQLATDTGCGAGTINYVFGSLDQLILQANARTMAQIAACLDAALEATQGSNVPSRMQALALAYLDYAETHSTRWDALFRHRLADGSAVPDWYDANRLALIGRIATCLGDDPDAPQALSAARTIFEAVHGVIVMGFEDKLGGIGGTALRDRVTLLTGWIARAISPDQICRLDPVSL